MNSARPILKGKIAELKVSSEASGITIERALEILESARTYDPKATVDLMIYHVVKETEIDEAVEDPEMRECPPCPKCGSHEVLPKAKGTFQYDGLICIVCGHTWPGPWPEKPRLIIKSWRKAWWEK